MRLSFIIWLFGVVASLYFNGFCSTIFMLIVFHYGIMRCLPYYLFDIEAVNYFDIYVHIGFNDTWTKDNDYCYVRMDLDNKFSDKSFEDFV